MSDYKCGIASISFRSVSQEDLIKAVADAGLDCIEWGSDVHAPYDNEENLCQIVKLQEKYGVFCSSYGTYFRLGKDDIEVLPSYIKAAKTLGTNVLRLWCGVKGSASHSEEEKEELFALCKKAAQIAQAEDAILSMECHAGTYTDGPQSTLELMQFVNSPSFRMYWQPNQNKDLDYNIDFAKLIFPYTTNLHAFYWEGAQRFPLENGREHWEKYLEIFDSPRAILLEFIYDDSLESLKSEAKTLMELTGRI